MKLHFTGKVLSDDVFSRKLTREERELVRKENLIRRKYLLPNSEMLDDLLMKGMEKEAQ